jgi:hypothetical protein
VFFRTEVLNSHTHTHTHTHINTHTHTHTHAHADSHPAGQSYPTERDIASLEGTAMNDAIRSLVVTRVPIEELPGASRASLRHIHTHTLSLSRYLSLRHILPLSLCLSLSLFVKFVFPSKADAHSLLLS